ncbi:MULTISPECIES: hypothetical protein [Streptococcus]|uniref:Uncharacterized protein n=1 Tax=Streptococcus sobrinus W1703 TaxID=1227275 RepID=U2IYP1_9STRE|nr:MULTISPECIES: hypothetical protein [Streptococcus]ERJ79076.1 hypothetical protein HMPREF1557_00076 [Streptococcus sobrinus W1703]
MIEGYSIMDWVTLGGVVGTVVIVIIVMINSSCDTRALLREFEILSEKQKELSEEIRGILKKIRNE